MAVSLVEHLVENLAGMKVWQMAEMTDSQLAVH